MTGKVCLVTGATSGIGEHIARGLAEMGATVVGVGRDAQKCKRVRRLLEHTHAEVDFLLCDLSVNAEIQRLAETFKSRYDHLDVLVNDAGATFKRRRESVEGLEMTFALNHLGYFRLTTALLDMLKASAPARIVVVSSLSHQSMKLNFGDLQNAQSYDQNRAYGQSKLANLLFTYELARRLAGSGVTVNAFNPGVVETGFNRNNNGPLLHTAKRAAKRLLGRRPLTAAEGARTGIYLASSDEVAGVTGKYFTDKKAVSSSEASYDEEAARKLWEVSEALSST
jgi:NAD(P)-dependent dehydrogenase (short-subunit alcohol dehydrogenase family)